MSPQAIEAAAKALFANDSLWVVATAAQKSPWLARARRAIQAAEEASTVTEDHP